MLDASIPKLQKNPIVEAVIQFRFSTSESVVALEDALHVAFGLSIKEEIRQVTFKPNPPAAPQVSESVQGFRFSDPSSNVVISVTGDSFSHSFVNIYGDWNSFVGNFSRNWEICRAILKPNNIARIGLRYINRIMVPAKLDQVSDYFNLAGSIDTHVTGTQPDEYFYRIGMAIPSIDGGRAVVAQVLDKRAPTDIGIPIIFDIDTYIIKDFKTASPEPLQLLARLREQKNLIFFKTLTEKGISIFR